jgi:photosystem II stability/assembly factor-like uncharacterized protein
MNRLWLFSLMVVLALTPCRAQWEPQKSGTQARLRGLSVVSPKIAWASGSDGTCLRTTDGGATWVVRTVPQAADLDFRDIEARDENRATLLSIGPGVQSRIYQTADGGATWTLRYTNPDPKGFLDAIAFWDTERGLALGDPVEGLFAILLTEDRGRTWTPIARDSLPAALTSEGAFAASGTCLVVQAGGYAWFGTGGGIVSRVFRTTDWGKTWTAHETPVRAGSPSAGIFSLAFRDANHGIAVGGDFKAPEDSRGFAAGTHDGGRTWTLAKGRAPGGYRSAACWVPDAKAPTCVAVGPTGTDLSHDGGEDWQPLAGRGYDAAAFVSQEAGWAVGEGGRIGRFRGAVMPTR